jgi:hypothetical protein
MVRARLTGQFGMDIDLPSCPQQSESPNLKSNLHIKSGERNTKSGRNFANGIHHAIHFAQSPNESVNEQQVYHQVSAHQL